MKSSMNVKANQKGFTLIELVVVIVILGILAVTAAPRFIDVQDDARTATLDAIKGSIESVKALVHSKSLIAGNETVGAAAASGGAAAVTPVVVVNGVDVNVSFGYPRSNTASVTEWEVNLLDIAVGAASPNDDGEFVVSSISDVIYITPDPDGTNTKLTVVPTTCFVIYTEAASAANADIPVTAVTDC
ncbi:prepilin-type N-terminal cleavage/methylation domain-containing protein [Colwellia psychrerythraea]|uniref:MSHA pilin protein MshA n=1 Tax=Colwellia psychrerythraea (strain 34H / ATCC BAA-681) TaxID=167879 RepID=Q47VF5_COLP3|nr:type II secretion system protein [Colwellia psychrerythraea]AAZ27592.1 MSHA pilin protein MshA [Colwellia psychrerythraea 34H]